MRSAEDYPRAYRLIRDDGTEVLVVWICSRTRLRRIAGWWEAPLSMRDPQYAAVVRSCYDHPRWQRISMETFYAAL